MFFLVGKNYFGCPSNMGVVNQTSEEMGIQLDREQS
jgi:hypothetical protein